MTTTQLLDVLANSDIAGHLLVTHWVADGAFNGGSDLTSLPRLLMTSRSLWECLRPALQQWLRCVFDATQATIPTMARFSVQYHFHCHFPSDHDAFVTRMHRWLAASRCHLGQLVTMASFVTLACAETRLLHAARWEDGAIKYDVRCAVTFDVRDTTALGDVFYLDTRTNKMHPLLTLEGVTECRVTLTDDDMRVLTDDASDSLKPYLFLKSLRMAYTDAERLALWYYYRADDSVVHLPPRTATPMRHVFVDQAPLYSPCNRVMATLRSLLYAHSDAALSASEKALGVALSLRMPAISQRFVSALELRHTSAPCEYKAVTLGVNRQAVKSHEARLDRWEDYQATDSDYDSGDGDDAMYAQMRREMDSSESDEVAELVSSLERHQEGESKETSEEDDMPPLG